MASPTIYSSGFNFTGTVFAGGPSVAQLLPSYISGAVQWLDTIGGNNANSGAVPELPVKTLAQAITNSAANGLIVIGQGSSETIASQLTPSLAGLTVWGCGAGSSRPVYTSATSGSKMIAASGAGQRWRNIYFRAPTTADGAHLDITGANVRVRDCYFECATNGGGILGDTGAAGLRVSGCSFVATGAIPVSGYASTAGLADVMFEDTTFDGASVGWSSYAFSVSSAAATRLYFENVSFRNRSDLGVTVTGCSYGLFGVINDGTSRVVLAA
jgi:hypothetical protein